MLDPCTFSIIDWPAEERPMVVVVVDSEAEFDWTAGAPRRAMGVTSVKAQLKVQSIFERYEVRPTYVLDYPVSSTPEAYEIIRELHQSGTCEIGAHLQPWDNPPFFERKTDENSYPGNLPFELEREKLVRLTRIIEENVGVRPRIYKAGRYGVGRATAQILAELGYEIDLSVVPGTNLTRQFGPDFSHCGAHPYWFGKAPALLEIPLCVGYTGLLAHTGRLAYGLTMNERLKVLHVPGILARLGLIERITLTPEGISFEELCRLTFALLREGHRIFNFTYHSPSLAPGNTPYVRNQKDLHAFSERIDRYLHFLSRSSAAWRRRRLKSRRSPNDGACRNPLAPGATRNPIASLIARPSRKLSSGRGSDCFSPPVWGGAWTAELVVERSISDEGNPRSSSMRIFLCVGAFHSLRTHDALGRPRQVGDDEADGTAKLQQQTTVEIKPQSVLVRLTRRVPHCRSIRSPAGD